MSKFKTLILFTLIISINSIACSFADAGKEDLKTLQEKTFKISSDKDIIVEASFGDVLITSWDNNEVYVKILGNEKTREKVEFYFDNSDSEVKVRAEHEKSSWGWSSRGMDLRFEIKVPKKFNSRITTAGGDIRLANVDGKNALKTSGGDISIRIAKGDLNIRTSGGDISLDEVSGKINASTSGGDITANKFTGNFDVSTSGGDIDLTGSNATIEASTSGGDITLYYSGENKGIKLSTSGGDIDIKLPDNFNASALLSSSGGSVKSDFTGNNAVKISSNKFEADINNGGPDLIAKTSGGTVRVRK